MVVLVFNWPLYTSTLLQIVNPSGFNAVAVLGKGLLMNRAQFCRQI